MTLRRATLPVIALLALFLAAAARADQPIFYSHDGAAIGGYDTVAYFTSGAPVRGRPDIAVMWKGAVWLFSSMSNRERFEANPRAFAPQYGGYCAYGVSRGYTMETDPTSWQIIGGKLYLIHDSGVLALWTRDTAGNIAMSEANWPDVLFD